MSISIYHGGFEIVQLDKLAVVNWAITIDIRHFDELVRLILKNVSICIFVSYILLC